MIAEGDSITPARSFAEHHTNPEFFGWIWVVISIDPATLTTKNVNQCARFLGTS
ncbi:type II toxin-antitoxin system HicB family antitoxin [Janthinobacterium sp. HH01]|uniref:type II toxin-antitoxin system HicB family antitoxin n=1 Tax=Janthinobacterium sp. HH01 TaxID=1198452 RepID=UPI001267A5C9